jgi:hypothetical protein
VWAAPGAHFLFIWEVQLMTASKSLVAVMTLLAVSLATPAQATINITSDEIWDGVNNPHAADGVTLTTTGTFAAGTLVSTYNIPTGMTIADNVNVFLHDISNPNTTMTVNWNFAPAAGPLTFDGPNSTIDTTKGGRNLAAKTFTINMNDNPIVETVAGAGRIINGIYVLGNSTNDSLAVAINAVGTAAVALGNIDVTKKDATGTTINVTTRGFIDLDNLATADVSSGGGSGGAINITGTSMTIGNMDTRTFRTGGGGNNGNIVLRALAQPTNSVGNFNGNTVAQNTLTLDGFVNTAGPQAGLPNGNLTTNAVKTTLASTFTAAINPAGLFTVNTGEASNGFTQAQLFVNNSAVTPNAVNYTVFHDAFGPSAVSWVANASGNWATDTNWTPNAAPNATNMVGTIGSVVTSPQTIYLNAAAKAKGLVFDTTSKVAVAGTSPLTLESNSGNASLSVLQGSHELQTQLTLNTNTDMSAASGTSLDINGVLNLNTKTLTISGAGTININNTVTGLGSIANGATLGTGGATGLAGDLSSTGTLAIDIGGAIANSFDSWSVTGNATLSGVLSVDAVGGFTPGSGQSFTVLTAANVSAASLTLGGPDAALFTLVKNPTSLVLQAVAAAVAGDYNHNGVVDAADYLVWRKTNGQTVTAGTGADGDGNGIVNSLDYSFWRTRFGNTSGSGSGLSGAAVPEPASALMALLAGLAITLVGRRRHS